MAIDANKARIAKVEKLGKDILEAFTTLTKAFTKHDEKVKLYHDIVMTELGKIKIKPLILQSLLQNLLKKFTDPFVTPPQIDVYPSPPSPKAPRIEKDKQKSIKKDEHAAQIICTDFNDE
ncbi:hypothetical protein L1887_18432 [Cichorium endivia]|nr:hypothetical protein L1887_18432 [Cichorium endivia]